MDLTHKNASISLYGQLDNVARGDVAKNIQSIQQFYSSPHSSFPKGGQGQFEPVYSINNLSDPYAELDQKRRQLAQSLMQVTGKQVQPQVMRMPGNNPQQERQYKNAMGGNDSIWSAEDSKALGELFWNNMEKFAPGGFSRFYGGGVEPLRHEIGPARFADLIDLGGGATVRDDIANPII